MQKYTEAKIYTIRCKTDDTMVYVGSTCQCLCQRMSEHRRDHKRINHPKYLKMRDIGIDNFYIELHEAYPCESIEQLRKREGEVTREIGTMNSRIAGRTRAELEASDHRKQYMRNYRKRTKVLLNTP